MKEKKRILQSEISSMSSEKSNCENDLSVTKRKLNQYQQKLERMTTIYRNIESDNESYLQAVKKFETSSKDRTEGNYQVVDECINLIEEMEAVL